MALSAGTKLGPYEILSPLGAGGMGEVYLANDSKLDRNVAIKVLPETMTRDPERVARFEREAKLLASLNHSSIAAIHGFDDAGGVRFLVMEYVEGVTLGSHLKNGPVAVEDALDIARQIAEALEAAHGQGVIHRDLKPANVMIRPDGIVKVLDFGLAKAMADEPSGTANANSPTITANFTRPGVVLGTAAYMSPEQARGRELDKRTDIWSLGIILFECLTGQRLFQGETANDSMGAIMHMEPDWSVLPPSTPPTIQLLLRRCLTKDRKRRLHDIADARIELENALVDPTSSSLGLALAALDVKRRWLPPWPVNIAFAIIVAIAAMGGWFAKPETPKRLWNLTLGVPEDQEYKLLLRGQGISISADGRQIAIVIQGKDSPEAKRRLLLRRADQSEGVVLANTEDVFEACFSPDGNWIAFTTGTSLKKVSVRGGPATTILQADHWIDGIEWGEDGTIIFAEHARSGTDNGLRRISASGGTPQRLTSAEDDSENQYWHPHFLPDGSGITFSVGEWNAKWEDAEIRALRFGDASPKEIMKGGSGGLVLSTGHLTYRLEDTLMAAPFDLSRLEITGPGVPVLEGVGVEQALLPTRVAISRSGTLVYLPSTGVDISERSLTWIDHEGNMSPLSETVRDYRNLRISPDGTHISVVIRPQDDEEQGIYILERQRDLLRRLTAIEDSAWSHVWSSDGKWIVFSRKNDGGKYNLYRIPSDFSGQAERLTTSEFDQYPSDISPDGRLLLVTQFVPGQKNDIILLRLDERGSVEGEPTVVVASPSWDGGGRFSLDGKWISYRSLASGEAEVYVKAASGSGAAIQVSTEGGAYPRWSPVERKMFFSKTQRLDDVYSVSFSTEDNIFKPELPERMFKLEASDSKLRYFEVSPDGKQFLTIARANTAPDVWTNPRIVVNWFEDLKAKVPIE